MKKLFGLIQRPWGVYYLKNKITGEQTSLKTSDKDEAQRLLQARNDSESQPHFNLALARVYMNGSDPKLGTRTWQEVMEHIVERKKDETRRRWEVTGVFLLGDAPDAGDCAFCYDPNAVAYYLPNTKGWSATYSDLPTAQWSHKDAAHH